MADDMNIRTDATEPESYRLGLDAALKEAIRAFIDVRFVSEGDSGRTAFGEYPLPGGSYGYQEPAYAQRIPQASEPVFAKNMLTREAPQEAAEPACGAAPPQAAPARKQKARGGALGSFGRALKDLAHPSKREAASSAESSVLEEPSALEESYAYDFDEVFSIGDASAVGLKQWLDGVDAPFSTTLLRLIDERGYDDVDVYKRAGMSRQLFSRIRSDAEYRPAKKTVLALAVALRLNADEARDLLERAGFALSRSDKRDLVVEYFLENGKHDLMAVNQALYEFDQPLL